MSGSPAVRGFLVLLLSLPVVPGGSDWNVTYSSTQICASQGATVRIRCTYEHPHISNLNAGGVARTYWFTKVDHEGEPVDLQTEEENSSRVSYDCSSKSCSLTIRDLKETDSAVYKISFITDQPGGTFTAQTGVDLSVTEPNLTVKINSTPTTSSATVKCTSRCLLPDSLTYFWYRNGKKISSSSSSIYSGTFYNDDTVSCAVKRHEAAVSPGVCVHGNNLCSRVIYHERRICAFIRSTVDLSCTFYTERKNPNLSVYWFRSESNEPNPSKDLREDVRYLNRVHFSEESRVHTLKITDLKESDSAEYGFTFEAGLFKWGTDIPGTTLTVTDLQVQVSRLSGSQTDTYAELQCHSSCSPPGNLSYFWFINGRVISSMNSKTYSGWVRVRDNISCAVGENPQHLHCSSPAVYVPKRPSVSVSPSGEIVEGSSVTLTCSSDDNSAAEYSWYKDNEHLSNASGQNFTITDFRPEHSGNYHCETQNSKGRQISTSHVISSANKAGGLAKPTSEKVFYIILFAGCIPLILLAALFLFAFLWIRRKRSLKRTQSETPGSRVQEEPGELNYGSVTFRRNQEDPFYSITTPSDRQTRKEEEDIAYSSVKFHSRTAGMKGEESVDIYSLICKPQRLN